MIQSNRILSIMFLIISSCACAMDQDGHKNKKGFFGFFKKSSKKNNTAKNTGYDRHSADPAYATSQTGSDIAQSGLPMQQSRSTPDLPIVHREESDTNGGMIKSKSTTDISRERELSLSTEQKQLLLLGAIAKNNLDMVEKFIKGMSTLNFQDDRGNTPLNVAFKNLIAQLKKNNKYSPQFNAAKTIFGLVVFCKNEQGITAIRNSLPFDSIESLKESVNASGDPALIQIYNQIACSYQAELEAAEKKMKAINS